MIFTAGDALVFHCNILHKSNANNSERRRWAMLYSYNTRSNESPIPHHCPGYVPIDIVCMIPYIIILLCLYYVVLYYIILIYYAIIYF